MNPETKKYVAVAILGVILVGVVIYQVTRGGATATAAKEQAIDSTNQVATRPSTTKPAGQAAQGGGAVEFKTANVDIPKLLADAKPCDFDYEAMRIVRDPMAPLIGPGAGGGPGPTTKGPWVRAILERVVSGIVWDAANPCAVVDDEIVFRGSEVEVLVDYKPERLVVIDIGQDYVTFRGGEVELPVRLKE